MNLTKLAATARPATKTAARAALKAAGMRQTLAIELLSEVERLAELRRIARHQRIARKLGYSPVDADHWGGVRKRMTDPRGPLKIGFNLPSGTPAQRLDDLRRLSVAGVYNQSYRTATHGALNVVLTTDPARVGIAQTEYLDWELDRGAHKGKPARVQDTTVTVPTSWCVRVQRAGLYVVDGMMTLDASPLEAAGCELYAAMWLEQGRGTTVTARRGYIARSGSATYHASTADQALTGLARKSRALAVTAYLNSADLGELVARHADMAVSVGDARAVGACVYGIRSWCNAVGLAVAYDEATKTLSGCTTLGDLYAANQREPRSEARAVILRVLRRARVAVAG